MMLYHSGKMMTFVHKYIYCLALPHYRLRLSTAVAASSFYPMRGVVPHLVQVEFKNAARNRKRSRRRKASVLYDIRMTEGLLIVRYLFKRP